MHVIIIARRRTARNNRSRAPPNGSENWKRIRTHNTTDGDARENKKIVNWAERERRVSRNWTRVDPSVYITRLINNEGAKYRQFPLLRCVYWMDNFGFTGEVLVKQIS